MQVLRRLLSLASLALLSSGCAILGGSPPERYGGSATLTEAAGEASDTTGKERRLDVGDQVPPEPTWTESSAELSVTAGETETQPKRHGAGDEFQDYGLGLVAGGGSLGGQEFEGYGLGGLVLNGFVSRRWRIDLQLLALSPNLTAASVAGQGLKSEYELAADLSARFYLTPHHTFMGVYPLAGVRFGTLFWDYRQPVDVIADGEPKTISDDYLNYFAIYAGLGASLLQVRHVHSGIVLTVGARTYDDKTFEGFRNTLFPATGYSQLTYEISYRF